MVKSKGGVKKGPWTVEEDNLLLAYIQQHGHGSWQALPAKAGLKRCGKSCRLRWSNYLRPDIKRGKFTVEEERTIIQLHALLGNKWSAIATHLPKRTDNEIKNYWNTHLKKRLEKMGIDPTTHKPKFSSSPNLRHVAQWESARLEAEARLARESKLQLFDPSLLFPNSKCPNAGPKCPNAGPTAFSSSRPPRPKCLDILKAWQEMVFGLESPTSILNFSESSFTSHSINNISVPQLQFPGSGSATGHSANEGKVVEQVQETLLDANEFMGTLNGPNDDEWIFSNEFISSENADALSKVEMEGQNGNYWNSLLSMVDAPLSPSYHI